MVLWHIIQYSYGNKMNGGFIDIDSSVLNMHPRFRQEDKLLQSVISESEEDVVVTFLIQNTVNSIGKNFIMQQMKKKGRTVKSIKKMRPLTLSSIFEEYFSTTKADSLNVDVEDHDLSVLKSNDLVRFRPHFIATETGWINFTNSFKNSIFQFLSVKDYRLVPHTILSSIFVTK